MTRNTIYDRLREIGCSVETADATAEALEGISDKKIEAFMLWACGMNNCEVAREIGKSEHYVRDIISAVCKSVE